MRHATICGLVVDSPVIDLSEMLTNRAKSTNHPILLWYSSQPPDRRSSTRSHGHNGYHKWSSCCHELFIYYTLINQALSDCFRSPLKGGEEGKQKRFLQLATIYTGLLQTNQKSTCRFAHPPGVGNGPVITSHSFEAIEDIVWIPLRLNLQ